MSFYSKESIERLRDKADLIDVISAHVELKKAGAVYKGLCPFHDEKTPSFSIQKGDKHYHCFGCGAHGDSVKFLMEHLRLGFKEAIESLAERFHVPLEKVEASKQDDGPSKSEMKRALQLAGEFFHFHLLHTPEGHKALTYLRQRSIDIEFIRFFELGFSPKESGHLKLWLNSHKISNEVLLACGLLNNAQKDFFSERIMFPIRDVSGNIIGFSGRKIREEVFGGKYINTPETSLFKKSKVLFGLDHSRKKIVKERRAIIVEGQLDACRLIYSGFDFTVAGQGTAFGEGHVKELLQLGVNLIFLSLDQDAAGQEAAAKIGQLFQKNGVEVKVLPLPQGDDPDSFIKREGTESYLKLIEDAEPYITFLVKHESKGVSALTPAGKTQIIEKLTSQIRDWDHPLMIHETLRELAHLMQVPEDLVGINKEALPQVHIKRHSFLGHMQIDPDRILECDLLRWLVYDENNEFLEIAAKNLSYKDFSVRVCGELYEALLENPERSHLLFANRLNDAETRLLFSELLQKKIPLEKGKTFFKETLQKILDRNWLRKREEIKMKIQSNKYSEEEVFELLQEFDALKKTPPVLDAEVL